MKSIKMLAASASALALMTVAACGGGGGSHAAAHLLDFSDLKTTTPAGTGDAGTIKWNLPYEPLSLDPIKTFNYAENTVLANACDSLLRANPEAARSGAYDTSFADVAGGCPRPTGSTRAQLDLNQWQADVCETLGGTGSGSVQVIRSGNLYSALIAVRWNDRRARDRLGATGDAEETFAYRAGF